jgi:hypothetical protein
MAASLPSPCLDALNSKDQKRAIILLHQSAQTSEVPSRRRRRLTRLRKVRCFHGSYATEENRGKPVPKCLHEASEQVQSILGIWQREQEIRKVSNDSKDAQKAAPISKTRRIAEELDEESRTRLELELD